MHYIVYFLESINQPDQHYIGCTNNIQERLKRHNGGHVISTKKYKPWKIIYAELYLNKKDAYGREKFLKSGSGWKFLKKQLNQYFNSEQS